MRCLSMCMMMRVMVDVRDVIMDLRRSDHTHIFNTLSTVTMELIHMPHQKSLLLRKCSPLENTEKAEGF